MTNVHCSKTKWKSIVPLRNKLSAEDLSSSYPSQIELYLLLLSMWIFYIQFIHIPLLGFQGKIHRMQAKEKLPSCLWDNQLGSILLFCKTFQSIVVLHTWLLSFVRTSTSVKMSGISYWTTKSFRIVRQGCSLEMVVCSVCCIEQIYTELSGYLYFGKTWYTSSYCHVS